MAGAQRRGHSHDRPRLVELHGRGRGRAVRAVDLGRDASDAVVDREEIDRDKAAGELMFLGLRLTEGIRIENFRQRFGKSPAAFYPQIEAWIDGELLEKQTGYLRFTPKGLLLANSIFVHFM